MIQSNDHGIKKFVAIITSFLRSITNLQTLATDSDMSVLIISGLPVDFVGFESYFNYYWAAPPEFLESFLIKFSICYLIITNLFKYLPLFASQNCKF